MRWTTITIRVRSRSSDATPIEGGAHVRVILSKLPVGPAVGTVTDLDCISEFAVYELDLGLNKTWVKALDRIKITTEWRKDSYLPDIKGPVPTCKTRSMLVNCSAAVILATIKGWLIVCLM